MDKRVELSYKLLIEINASNEIINNLCGPLDENLKYISLLSDINVYRIGNKIALQGNINNLEVVKNMIASLSIEAANKIIDTKNIKLTFIEYNKNIKSNNVSHVNEFNKIHVKPRNKNQYDYIDSILNKDITFGLGPAGTGKTWLSVASAIFLLKNHIIKRLILTRPAIEAGEKLGFLPGDLTQKVDPYLRPLYDALYEMLGLEKVNNLFDKQIIEIAPLAYMRGRTLNDACIILDEAQNTTNEQLKMFLTRIGFGSKMIINGDPSQIDLMKNQESGLKLAVNNLKNINNIGMIEFSNSDIIRHPIISEILSAYEKK